MKKKIVTHFMNSQFDCFAVVVGTVGCRLVHNKSLRDAHFHHEVVIG